MNNHIFLGIFLPPLTFDAPPEMTFEDLRFYLNLNLSATEQKILKEIFSFFDLENVRSWVLQQPMTVRGSMPHETLKDKLDEGKTGIASVDKFLALYPSQEERVLNLHMLSKMHIKSGCSEAHPFLRKYFFLENTFRRILSTFRAETSLSPFELTQEELSSRRYRELYAIWQKRGHSYDIEKSIAQWKFLEVERMGEESPPFSFDRILSYLIRLLLVESRLRMKEDVQMTTLERLAKVAQ